MALNLTFLYRGPLSSCNYGCEYCPFAKHQESAAEHATDAAALTRFCEFIAARPSGEYSIFFTPWGEALIRRRYQQAVARLTQLPQVRKVAVQSNGAWRSDWVEQCDKAKLGLWLTFHPTQTTRAAFVARCQELHRRGVRFSVGVVGLKEHFEEIAALREELPPEIYLWVNAFKRVENYYAPGEVEFLTQIDRLFPVNNQRHASHGRACRTGHEVLSVDGDGTLRRCHFVKTPLGNLYEAGWETALQPRPCPNESCGCHIGYVHLNELKLYEVFGEGVLERRLASS